MYVRTCTLHVHCKYLIGLSKSKIPILFLPISLVPISCDTGHTHTHTHGHTHTRDTAAFIYRIIIIIIHRCSCDIGRIYTCR